LSSSGGKVVASAMPANTDTIQVVSSPHAK
jgi:hypothetical protein